MQTITFECEVITPMFLAGADGTTPELRAPSIKGALRFWWRAMNGHLVEEKENGSFDYSKLKQREMDIFGGTFGDDDEKAKRSSFNLYIEKDIVDTDKGKDIWQLIGYEPKISAKGNTFYTAKKSGAFEGVGYLYYSTFMSKLRDYIKPNARFSFTISFQNEKYIDDVINALSALTVFGGLGTRSRRGAGGFKVIDITNCSNLNLEQKAKSTFLNDFSIEELIKRIIIKNHNNQSYSHLKNSLIFTFNVENNWLRALEFPAKQFKSFRKTEEANYQYTPNFGFPILHRGQNTTMQGGKWVTVRGKDELEKLERRASPLIFKVYKINDREYVSFILWLNGELLSDDYYIMDKQGNEEINPSNNIINDFFDQLNFEEKIEL